MRVPFNPAHFHYRQAGIYCEVGMKQTKGTATASTAITFNCPTDQRDPINDCSQLTMVMLVCRPTQHHKQLYC